ncbi:MAG: phage tail protein [Dyella sp.]
MAAKFPNGTVFAISTTLAAAVAITAISNADPGVATTATPPEAGDILVLASGWPLLNNRIVRADAPTANGFTLEGVDTSSLKSFAAGAGAGSYMLAGSWVNLSQVTDSSSSGGDQQYASWQYMEDPTGRQQQRPTFKNAKSIALTQDYDPELPWYAAMQAADGGDPVVLRATLPGGDQLYYLAYASFDGDPTLDLNKNMSNKSTFSLISPATRYQAA